MADQTVAFYDADKGAKTVSFALELFNKESIPDLDLLCTALTNCHESAGEPLGKKVIGQQLKVLREQLQKIVESSSQDVDQLTQSVDEFCDHIETYLKNRTEAEIIVFLGCTEPLLKALEALDGEKYSDLKNYTLETVKSFQEYFQKSDLSLISLVKLSTISMQRSLGKSLEKDLIVLKAIDEKLNSLIEAINALDS